MAVKYFVITMLLGLCANANAEWFLRGTHNAWAATQMESAGAGTNTMYLEGVVFAGAGSIKFDRFGDWRENYGAGGNNIAVAAGTWNIKFFTDTKTWNISAAQTLAAYHLRGTHNAWAEGTLMTRLGTTDNYELCVNFANGDGNGGPRFKVDPNGGWGDSIPAADFSVTAGWVKILFNSASKVISVQQNLAENCGTSTASSAAASAIAVQSSVAKSSVPTSSLASSASASIYHLRGTFNSWQEGTLMARVGTSDNYERCVNFTAGDSNGGPRFKVDPYGAWGDAIPAADYPVTAGWVKIIFNSASKVVSTQQHLAANCLVSEPISSSLASVVSQSSTANSSVPVSPSSVASSSQAPQASIYHLRGTFNSWLEGTLMARVGTSDNYERCVNFAAGDSNGGPRFKVDPNGGWGDAIPAADFAVAAGWVKITFNSVNKGVSVQQHLPSNCAAPAASSAVASSSVTATIPYHIRGTFNNWLEGTLMTRVGTSDNYQSCVNFTQVSNRFKVDPSGGWGDALPAADFIVSPGWVNILFNSSSKNISVQQNLTANCGVASSSSSTGVEYFPSGEAVYHVRGDFNGWAEGALLLQLMGDEGTTAWYEACVNFPPVKQRLRIDKNGGWGIDTIPQLEDVEFTGSGWTLIHYDRLSGELKLDGSLGYRCVNTNGVGGRTNPFPPDIGVPGPALPTLAFVPIHIRGTNNAFAEGTLMKQIGSTDFYTACVHFAGGDANGGPRFRVDPDGSWGDAVPATDVKVAAGWVAIGYNSRTKEVTKQVNMRDNCVPDIYYLMGTQRSIQFDQRTIWVVGDFIELVDGEPQLWKICRYFDKGDEYGGPRFRIVPNIGDGGDHSNRPGYGPASPLFPASGWTAITFTSPSSNINRNIITPPENINIRTNLAPNCTGP